MAIFGDRDGGFTNHETGGNNVLSVSGGTFDDPLSQETFYGDALSMTCHSRGGNDTIDGFVIGEVVAFGDADTMSGRSRGGNDTINVSDEFYNVTAYGDARVMRDNTQGGRDHVTASSADGGNSI